MSLRKHFEAYRGEQAGRLNDQERRLREEKVRLSAAIVAVDAKLDEVQQNRFRLKDLPSTDEECPACFFNGRDPTSLTPIPGDERVDRFRCRACEYEFAIEV